MTREEIEQLKEENKVLTKKLKRISRAFDLYKKIDGKMKHYEAARGSIFGIATHEDELAKKWQSKVMTREILNSYITGEPVNWWHARYLNNEQIKLRMDSWSTDK